MSCLASEIVMRKIGYVDPSLDAWFELDFPDLEAHAQLGLVMALDRC